jgi:hypothetical protein
MPHNPFFNPMPKLFLEESSADVLFEVVSQLETGGGEFISGDNYNQL